MPGIATGNRLGNGLKFNASSATEGGLAPLSGVYNPAITQPFSLFVYMQFIPRVTYHDANKLQVIVSTINATSTKGYWLYFVDNGAGFLVGFQWKSDFSVVYQITSSVLIPYRSLGSVVVNVPDFNATNGRIYVNGIDSTLVASNQLTGASDPRSTTSLYIGKQVSATVNYTNNGVFYELRFINRVLTPQEVLKLHASDGATREGWDRTEVRYTFEQKSGNTLNDISGNNLNAPLTGMTTALGASNQWVDNMQQPILI